MAKTNISEMDTHDENDYPCGDEDYFSTPEPGVKLYFYGGSRDNMCVSVDSCGEFLFGRTEESAFRFSDDNRIDARVSRRHALLRVLPDAVMLVNQAPRNGLMLNGVSLADYQEEPLNDTDVITLGGKGPHIRIRIGDLRELAPDCVCHGEQNAE